MPKSLNLAGKRFGELTAVERIPKGERYHSTRSSEWRCICTCGTWVIRTTEQLRLAARKGKVPKCKNCLNKYYQNHLIAKNKSSFNVSQMGKRKEVNSRYDLVVILEMMVPALVLKDLIEDGGPVDEEDISTKNVDPIFYYR